MEDNNNTIVEENERKTEEYKFNFINIPWDDRTVNSKIGIVTLLVTFIIVTASCVINNLNIHYKSFNKHGDPDHESKCHLVKMETTPFVAKIHLISSQELLCLGAIVGSSSVIANGICVKSGPIRIGVGTSANPICKKGFTVESVNQIKHDGAISNSIVLLTTLENIAACSSPIRIADSVNYETKVFILGRPLLVDRAIKTLSRQPAFLISAQETSNITISSMINMKKSSLICVKDLANCPVRAGDLLIQNNKVLGLASTSVHRTDHSKMACFASLYIVRDRLTELISETAYDST